MSYIAFDKEKLVNINFAKEREILRCSRMHPSPELAYLPRTFLSPQTDPVSPQKTVSSLFPQPLSSTVYTRLYGFDSSRDLLDCKEFQPVNLKGNQS